MFATRDFVKLAVAPVPSLVAARLFVCTERAMKSLKRIVWCSAAIILVPLTTHADPLTTMDEVGAAIMSCWKPPAGVEKSAVTLSFSLRSDGSLVGPPQPTSINVAGDEKVRQQFVAAAMDAVDRCTPVELSPALAQGIGGNPFSMDFASSDKAQTLSPSN
jgi:hypothetical protein